MVFQNSVHWLRMVPRVVKGHHLPLQPHVHLPLCPIHRFHTTRRLARIESHILSDIGEGIKEVQIIQWFVEEGATIEEWGPLCEVQSDKATVEITSKFTGTIKKIHFAQDEIVRTGDSLVEILVEDEDGLKTDENHEILAEPAVDSGTKKGETTIADAASNGAKLESENSAGLRNLSDARGKEGELDPPVPSQPKASHTGLATPAVRMLLKQHKLDIQEIHGTGRDGRVLKEDIDKYLANRHKVLSSQSSEQPTPDVLSQDDPIQKLSLTQMGMFKSMTKSLSIPHFLYSDTINITRLALLRDRLNASRNQETTPKLSFLPFIVKAISLALKKYPLLNARLDTGDDGSQPQLVMRSSHNIGIAMDTPTGLLVPVIHAVDECSVTAIAQDLERLSESRASSRWRPADLQGGTFTVSNIGSIGGEVVAPVIVEGQMGIVGVGKIKTVPIFSEDGKTVCPAQMMTLSWSADHRVVDGATMARMARMVHSYLEEPGTMIIEMR